MLILLINELDDGYKLTYLGYDYLALSVIIIIIIEQRHSLREVMSSR